MIGQRIERARDRSRSALACDCRICMDCGAVVHGGQTFIEAMQLAWDEYGWNRIIGQRIYAVIRHRRMDLEGKVVPAWFAIGALGWNGREVMRLCDAYAASRGRKSHRPPGRAKDQVGQGQARPGPTESGAGV